MPTYQYACTACGHRFEAVQSFSDASLTDCPECAGRLRKVFSSVGIVFKGSGFYRTDSRAGADMSSDKGSSADSGGSSGKDGKDGGASTGKEAAAKKPEAGSSASGPGSSGSGSGASGPGSSGSGASGSGSSGSKNTAAAGTSS